MKTAIFEVVNGVEGPCLYVGDEDNGHRLAGPKPWGGGTMLHQFKVDVKELRAQLDVLDPQPEVIDVKLIAEALRRRGLTLVRTSNSYHIMDLGNIKAQNKYE